MQDTIILIVSGSVVLFIFTALTINKIVQRKERRKWDKIESDRTALPKTEEVKHLILSNRSDIAKVIEINKHKAKFKGHFKVDNFLCYFIEFYYPKKRFTDLEISDRSRILREYIWEFKDTGNHFIHTLTSCLINQFGHDKLKEYILTIIPASTKLKTDIRFKLFSTNLCRKTGMGNGYYLIQNRKDRPARHISGGTNNESLINYLKINPNLKGKSVILLDDVYTTGKSFRELAHYLKSIGAKNIIGMFLGKTTWEIDK